MFLILFAAILLTACDSISYAQITTVKPLEQALKSESIMLPYVLKKPQKAVQEKQDPNKRFMLLTKNGISDDSVTEQSQLSLASKTHKVDDWDRHSALHYPAIAHVYPWHLPNPYFHGSYTNQPCYSAEPTNIILFLNIGVLAYVLVAVVGLLNRLQDMANGNMMQGNFDGGHFYYKSNENEARPTARH